MTNNYTQSYIDQDICFHIVQLNSNFCNTSSEISGHMLHSFQSLEQNWPNSFKYAENMKIIFALETHGERWLLCHYTPTIFHKNVFVFLICIFVLFCVHKSCLQCFKESLGCIVPYIYFRNSLIFGFTNLLFQNSIFGNEINLLVLQRLDHF